LKIKKEKLFLRNQALEQNPSNHKSTPLYQKIKRHIEKTGYIINPLLVVKENEKYKIIYGNNRYLIGLDLGFKEFPIKILPNEEVLTITEAAKTYKEINIDEI
jgi:ParB-like chromosome segregation protein Spo0J